MVAGNEDCGAEPALSVRSRSSGADAAVTVSQFLPPSEV